ncbi:hypothetical protein OAG71_01320 [bacterium]|nr:hypothetical protein [bacterium]
MISTYGFGGPNALSLAFTVTGSNLSVRKSCEGLCQKKRSYGGVQTLYLGFSFKNLVRDSVGSET